MTISQPKPDGELYATPHYCLRQLGLIDEKSRRGGRQYQQFSDALRRLSLVSYENDAFYDPLRKEHRRVSFGFLSYSLPLEPQSSRAWRLVWDPLFFELVCPVGGNLIFDIDIYRSLDPATRRLFLLLSKISRRRSTTPRFELRHLCVDVLGFAASVENRDLRIKLKRCIEKLVDAGVVSDLEFNVRSKAGSSHILLRRGAYFQKPRGGTSALSIEDSALFEPLTQIGFDARRIRWLVKSFSVPMLREWADITLAAMLQKDRKFIRKSPQAYFVDNIKHAAAGTRTPPDWWHELKKRERDTSQRPRSPSSPERIIDPSLLDRLPDQIEEFVRLQISSANR